MKRLLNRIATLAALVAVAGTVSCSKELPAGEPQSDGIRLEFSAALDQGFGPAPTAAQGATPTPTATATRGTIMGANFPAGTYLISLAIAKNSLGTPWAVGYDNIKAEMTVDAYGAQKWRFLPKGSSATWKNHLSLPENTVGELWVSALYPYDADMTYEGAYMRSKFDLTTAAEQANQTDAMYAKQQALLLAAGDRSRAVLLSFSHFFTMFEFQIAPMFDTPSRISRIEVASGGSLQNINNKGALLGTGDFPTMELGPVAVTDTRPMTMGVYNTYRVMFPPAASNDDGDIVFTFTDDMNPSVAPLSLPIKREWLGTYSSEARAGKRYVLKMLYNNAPTGQGSLTVSDWAVGGEVDDMWGTPTPNQGYLCWGAPGLVTSGKFDGATIKTIPGSTKNSYNGYVNTLANAAGNGGAATWEDELPYYRLEVDKTDVTGTWAEVWDKCKQKAPAGQWRLPRQSELIMMYLNSYGLRQTSNFIPFDGVAQATSYASGSEYFIKELSSYTIRCLAFQDGSIAQGSKDKLTWLARCVRELP